MADNASFLDVAFENIRRSNTVKGLNPAVSMGPLKGHLAGFSIGVDWCGLQQRIDLSPVMSPPMGSVMLRRSSYVNFQKGSKRVLSLQKRENRKIQKCQRRNK